MATRRESLAQEEGAVAVEFAILLPLLLIILFATIGFGQALTRVQNYVSAAREGARYVAVHCESSSGCSQDAVDARVAEAAAGYPIGVADVTVSPNINCTPPSLASVSWTQPITIQIPFIPTFTLSVPISGTFRCE